MFFQNSKTTIIDSWHYQTTHEINFSANIDLRIKKNFQFEEKSTFHGKISTEGTKQGIWKLNGDTLFLIPNKYYSINLKDKSQGKKILKCEPDTLIYKDNVLWRLDHETKKLEKEYERAN